MNILIVAFAFMVTAPHLFLPKESNADRLKRVHAELLLPFQARWAADRSRIKAMEKCRQAGISWTEAYVCVDESAKQGAKRDTWVSSRDLTQAQLFVNDSKGWCGVHNHVATDHGLVVIDPEKDIQAYKVSFKTGRSIYSLSSNPDAQAGKRGRRVGDEFALQKEQRRWYAITYPGLQWGGQMALISTHRGTQSFFNKDIVEPARDPSTNKKKVSLHTVTIQKAVEEGLWLKIKQQLEPEDERFNYTDDDFLQATREECPDEETWLQEYCCIPADDAAAFLSWEDITACGMTALERRLLIIPAEAPRFLGYDVARRRDLSVITQLVQVNGRMILEKLVVMEKTPFHEQQRRFFEMMDQPSVRRAAIDASGLGMQMAETAGLKYGERVLQVMFTMQSKQELAFPLKARFEDRSILIPVDVDKESRLYTADLRSIKKTVTSAGNIIITSEAGATDGHADRFWSLALANHAAHTQGGAVVYRPVDMGSPSTGFGEFSEDQETGLWLPN